MECHTFPWIQDPGSRILDLGSLIQETGSRIQDPGSLILDPGSWIQDPGSRIRDPGSWIHDPGSRILDHGSCIQDPGSRNLDPGSCITHPGSRILDPESWITDPELPLELHRIRRILPSVVLGALAAISGRQITECRICAHHVLRNNTTCSAQRLLVLGSLVTLSSRFALKPRTSSEQATNKRPHKPRTM